MAIQKEMMDPRELSSLAGMRKKSVAFRAHVFRSILVFLESRESEFRECRVKSLIQLPLCVVNHRTDGPLVACQEQAARRAKHMSVVRVSSADDQLLNPWARLYLFYYEDSFCSIK